MLLPLSLVLLLCGHSCSVVSHPKPSCRYPPSQWCRSLEIAIQCKVLKQCMELRAVAPPPNAAPVSVSVFYQSLCPAWRHFLSQQLFPTWTMLRDILSVHLVPYSASKDVPSESFVPCQRQEPECSVNMIEACVVELTGASGLEIISCMESSADVVSAARACLHLYAPALSWASVQSCVNGSRGPLLVNRSGAAARALSPAPSHLPWVTFNGVYTDEQQDRAMSSLFTLVCQLYQGIKPPVCTGVPVHLDRGYC
ncbi:gamma-interferon-inducible lysosomal thiol reductase [Periophthalmus magnuspinnatus]|uniref:gamma-interferon-inducible lysosomal thiol reductase n=1 Tax=Periophthalmus magnuspinnatus TaxID=409849 RepID=UPI00145AACD1|nr:gamma-interferon-inducible lysosomal thiol reductase [Periophthalmus magnuspinnatus]